MDRAFCRIIVAALLATTLVGCTDKDVEGLKESLEPPPPTIFDPPPHDPKNDNQKLVLFIVRMEQKYKREAFRNAIDLHFVANGENRMKVRVTYDHTADPTTASSIADAAVDLTKRLKHEDPSLKDLDFAIDRELKARD